MFSRGIKSDKLFLPVFSPYAGLHHPEKISYSKVFKTSVTQLLFSTVPLNKAVSQSYLGLTSDFRVIFDKHNLLK